jgi:hypothetical protein
VAIADAGRRDAPAQEDTEMAKRLILAAVLAVTAVFLVACEVEEEAEGPDATPAPATAAAQATPTAQATATVTPVNLDWGKAQLAIQADNAKPRFRGEMGDFVIDEPNKTVNYTCPEPYQPGSNPEQSELYFDLPGAVIDSVGSCEGKVISITAGVPDEGSGAIVGRVYFVGPKFEQSFNAPAERLKLITVAGRPAIAMLPIPDCISCLSEVGAIERFPTEAAPGIVAWAHTYSGLDKAIALVEQIMAAGQ